MKPFDLQAAMRGEPIVTRGGQPAEFIAYREDSSQWPVCFYAEGEFQVATINGELIDSDHTQSLDLFMAPKTTTRRLWLTLRADGSAYGYLTKPEAEAHAKKDAGKTEIREIVWEVEE